MLKKLVKYGNSHALLLDRTILALLGLDEGGAVKLRIEGETLIVKAQEVTKHTDSLMLSYESVLPLAEGDDSNTIMDYVSETMRQFCADTEQDPEAMTRLKEWLPGTENEKKMRTVFQEMKSKYQDELSKLSSKEFQKDLGKLNKKYHGNTLSKDFNNEVLALRLKHAPKIAEMDEEIRQAAIKLGCPQKK